MEGFPEYNFPDFQSTIFLIEGFPEYNFPDFQSTIFLMEAFPEYNFPNRRISRGKLLVPDLCHFSTNQKIGSHFVCLARSPDTILEEYQIHICSSEEDQNVKS